MSKDNFLVRFWHRLRQSTKSIHKTKSYDLQSLQSQISELNDQGKFITALDQILSVLENYPTDQKILKLATSVLLRAQNPTCAHKAIEPLTEKYFLDQRFDSLYCECESCGKFWIPSPINSLPFDWSNAVSFDPYGGSCAHCGRVFCSDCAENYQCPHCKVTLTLVKEPNGRKSHQMSRDNEPLALVMVLREGPIPPTREYINKLLRSISSEIFEQKIEIMAVPITPWPNKIRVLEMIREVLTVDNVCPVFDHGFYQDKAGTNLCVVKVYKLAYRDSSSRFKSDKDALEIESLIDNLGKTRVGINPAIAQLTAIGEQATPHLLSFLRENSNVLALSPSQDRHRYIKATTQVIGILGNIGDTRVIPLLEHFRNSHSHEFSKAAQIALAQIHAKQNPQLRIDPHKLYDQISEVWVIFFKTNFELYSYEILHRFCREAINDIPDANFSSVKEKAHAWSMVGSLVYKSLHPEWTGIPAKIEQPCPEAKKCYAEAVKLDYVQHWEDLMRRF